MDSMDFEIEETLAASLQAVASGNENASINNLGHHDILMSKIMSTPTKILEESKTDPALSLRISQQGSAFRPVDGATGSPFRKTPMPKSFQSNGNDLGDLSRFQSQTQMNAFQHHMPMATPLQRGPDAVYVSPNDIPNLVSQLVGQEASVMSPQANLGGQSNTSSDANMGAGMNMQHSSLFSDTNTFKSSPARSDRSTGSGSMYSQPQGPASIDTLGSGAAAGSGDLPVLNMDPLFADNVIRPSGNLQGFSNDSVHSGQRYPNTMNYYNQDVTQRMSGQNSLQHSYQQQNMRQQSMQQQHDNFQNTLPVYHDSFTHAKNANSPIRSSLNSRVQSVPRIGGMSDPGPLPRWNDKNSTNVGAFDNIGYRNLLHIMPGQPQTGSPRVSGMTSSPYKREMPNSRQDYSLSSSQSSLNYTGGQPLQMSRSFEEKSLLDHVGPGFGRLNPNGPTFDPQNTPTRVHQRFGDNGRGPFAMRESNETMLSAQSLYDQQQQQQQQQQGIQGHGGTQYLGLSRQQSLPQSMTSSWESTRSATATDLNMSFDGGFGRQQMNPAMNKLNMSIPSMQTYPNSPGSQRSGVSGAYQSDDHASNLGSSVIANAYLNKGMSQMPGMPHGQQYRGQYASSSPRVLAGPQTSPPQRPMVSHQHMLGQDGRQMPQMSVLPEARHNVISHQRSNSFDLTMHKEAYMGNVHMKSGHGGSPRNPVGVVHEKGLKNSRDGSIMINTHAMKKQVPISQTLDRDGKNNRQELVESPTSKSAYKDFYRQFRIKERESAEAAKEYAEKAISWIPQKAVWRVKLELADMAKRKNDFEDARRLYKEVCQLQPLASQGWLEWSKMEEECGNFHVSLDILKKGLRGNLNESLLTRAIKQHERMPNVEAARHLLSRLKHQSIDRVWRAIFEGALFEERAGQSKVARKFFKLLMEHVPWYGPIYFEAYKLEDKEERDSEALDVVQKGLRVLPRYGPLWFGLLRMMERKDASKERKWWYTGRPPLLTLLRAETTRAIRSISRELVWKIHFELAQAEERAADVAAFGLRNLTTSSLSRARHLLLGNARVALVRSLLACPSNLRWKVWLAGARLELSAGSLSRARKLLCKAFEEVPPKSRSHIYLECSRVEEYAGNVDAARRILQRACVEVRAEWKVFLEAVLLEARAGDLEGAVRMAEYSLKYHSGTGRLWAILVQLCHRLENLTPKASSGSIGGVRKDQYAPASKETPEGISQGKGNDGDDVDASSSRPIQKKENVFLRALLEVPKSGEVWCEGARCNMNPLLVNSFDLASAQRNLKFAIQFTPQYGDTFIEYLRLEMLCQVFLPRVLAQLGLPFVPFVRRFLCNDMEADLPKLLGDYKRLQQVCPTDAPLPVPAAEAESAARRKCITDLEMMKAEVFGVVESLRLVEKGNLERRCLNADPNYGTAWFFCRGSPIDSPKATLSAAQDTLVHELFTSQSVYLRAIYAYVLRSTSKIAGSVSREVLTASCLSSSTDAKRSSSAPSSRSSSVKRQYVGATSGASKSHSVDTTTLDLSRLNLRYSSPSEPSSGRQKPGVGNLPGLGCSDRSDGDSDLAALLAAQEDGVDQSLREAELLKDAEIVAADLRNRGWPAGISPSKCVDLLCVSVRFDVFSSTDFVAGLIGLNRLIFNKSLQPEGRRKVLFGSDQILP